MSTTARRYAAALYGAGCPGQTLYDSADYLTGTPALWQALCSPAVSAGEKKAVLARLPDFPDQEHLRRFYDLLAEKDRFPLLPQITAAYRQLERQAAGEGLCRLCCARDPGDEALGRLAKGLCRRYGYRALTFELEEDPQLLGGFVLEIDGVTYDKSVRGQLHALGQRLQEGGTL